MCNLKVGWLLFLLLLLLFLLKNLLLVRYFRDIDILGEGGLGKLIDELGCHLFEKRIHICVKCRTNLEVRSIKLVGEALSFLV